MSAHAAPDDAAEIFHSMCDVTDPCDATCADAGPDALDTPAEPAELVGAQVYDLLLREYAESDDPSRRMVAVDLTRAVSADELTEHLTDDAP